ncbi:MAG: heat-inducible transcriptional repressor HrcA [Anaerolineales bacterium]|nr:heat-inducible transcriptional repressor HrcA [Anaerolineales bacterium]MCS7248312.1 heat-inducible transcriptional repressor HrcA [Anaerolineales bacterium]MDW8162125.1 heat-inducible transcriptional repressor HrcA [Anaerolineales bacterium]MDW8447660.1 heat-inducible transcriptional repressor HrcA [Anaerolineales bacterium]
MSELTERQRLILALIIREYIETAQPVGSETLQKRYHLEASPATIRNEMAVLTEKGYLRQPHTSAGRVPTEEGYRYFVRQLMGHIDLPPDTKRTIAHQFYQAGYDLDRWMRLAASVLAQQAKAASLVTAPHVEQARFKHLELISTRGRQVLMVLVLAGGDVRQQMLTLAEPVSQEQLSTAASRLNQLLSGLGPEAISALNAPLDALEQDLVRLIVEELHHSSQILGSEVYRDGLTNVLAQPEFAESEAARRALRILEERPLLEDLLTRTLETTNVGGVQVLIGGEGTWEELRECSMILARYGAPGLATGALGVLGPIRMAYGRSISTVRFVAGLLSDLVVELHSE